MKFNKQEFTQKVAKLEKLLEEDFGILVQSIRRGESYPTQVLQRQKLIEQLQYHDIIRQKLLHVGEFAEVMEAEASRVADDAGNEATLLPGLLELSMAMLQFAGLEYEEIRDEIVAQLQGLGLGNSCHSEKYEQFRLELSALIKCLGRTYLLVDGTEDLHNIKLSAEKLKEVCRSFSMETEREIFRSLFNQEVWPLNEIVQESSPNDNIELF